jgi:hypothetical protein
MARELSVQVATHAFRQSLKYSSYEDQVSKMSWPLRLHGIFFAARTLIKYLVFINKTIKFQHVYFSINVGGPIKLQIDSGS